MKTILAPVDFSAITPAVIERATELGRAVGGRVVILHVAAPPIIPGDNTAMVVDLSRMYAKEAAGASTHLSRLKSQLHERGMDAETIATAGMPAAQILEQAQKLCADYIVMGSHGHGAIYDLLIGGTTHAVLNKAGCPVVVVPALLRDGSHAHARKGRRPAAKPGQSS
jgi:nucleotide-binding universal stress UspA family protein